MSVLLDTGSFRALTPLVSLARNSRPITCLKTSRITVRNEQRTFRVTTTIRERQQSPVEQIIDQVNTRTKAGRSSSKVYQTADDAVADLQDGVTILSSGFGLCGVAGMLRRADDFQLRYRINDANEIHEAH